jgi:tetratricopeptide (TPR) repeat protein
LPLLSTAVIYFTNILLKSPNNFEALLVRVIARCNLLLWDAAIEDVTVAKCLQPGALNVRKYRTIGLSTLGQTASAIEDLIYVIDDNSLDSDALLNHAKLHMEKGNFTLTISDFKALIRTTTLCLAECFYLTGDLEHAKHCLHPRLGIDSGLHYEHHPLQRLLVDLQSQEYDIAKAREFRSTASIHLEGNHSLIL